MYSSPTTFVAKLLAAMQVLMTLDMPLSTTVALPVTSKPIESTVENLAWQAWIELPPEQKQQVKSRKVTPKSIFTLPLRVECPDGHKQVDSKCIPIAIGSNDVLIDLNALGLLVGNTPAEDVYDYDDVGEELSDPSPVGGELPAGETVKSSDSLAVDLKPPTKDEPLKFNIFQNKFHIFHEEPLEDYSALSNEGLQSSEKVQNITVTTPLSNGDDRATAFKDLISEASNNSETIGEFFDQLGIDTSSNDNTNEQIQTSLNLNDDIDYKIEAISIPAFGNHSSIQLVTTIMDAEATTDDHSKQLENDLTTLLQTESFLPLLNHTTATTLQNPESMALTSMPLREPSDSSSDLLGLDTDEDVTTLATPTEQSAMEAQNKQEYTRSVTLNPMLYQDSEGSAIDASGDDDQLKESTVKNIDDTLETTTPIQLDDTTVIESHSFFSTTSAAQQELKELQLQLEQDVENFEELPRARKGQKDQHVVFKKSKVQPVEVLSTTTEPTATATTTTTATATARAATVTTAASMPAVATAVDELLFTTAVTATPLLTAHSENETNDRFYDQHSAKQDNDEVQLLPVGQVEQNTETANAAEASQLVVAAVTGQPATTATTTMKSSETETTPLTSEIDLAEELRLINELVKGIRKPTIFARKAAKIPTTKKSTTTTTTATTSTTTTTVTPIISTDSTESSSSSHSLSESTSSKFTLTASQIWSKIMPLLTTSTTTPIPENSANESFSESQRQDTNHTQTFDSFDLRSNRNSKIIRINGFNKISDAKFKFKDITTEAATTTTTITSQDFTSYSAPTSSSPVSSPTDNLAYEPYWWLPVSWRLNTPASTKKPPEEQDTAQSGEQPLLLRFWSTYTPRSS